MREPSKIDKPLLIVGVVVLVLVIGAVALVVGGPRTADLDRGTPAGTVQAYVQAVLDRDWDAARALLLEPGEPCRNERSYEDETVRAVVDRVDEKGARASVTLLVSFRGGDDPFNQYEWSDTQTFDLTRQGDWMIEQVPWRFQILCERGD